MGHGGMSYQLKFIRLAIIIINAIVFLIGATLLGEGIDLLVEGRFQNFTEFVSVVQTDSNNGQSQVVTDEILYILMIVPGFILLSSGYFGCSSAITQMQYLLFCYAFCVIINLTFQMAMMVGLIVFPTTIKRQFTNAVRLLIRDKYQGPLEKDLQLTSFLWDLIMYQLKCCGAEDKNDFSITKNWNRTNPWWTSRMPVEEKNFQYPLTCCQIYDSSNHENQFYRKAIECAVHGNSIYETGCYSKFGDLLHEYKLIIFITISFVLLIEMGALIFILLIHNQNRGNQLHYSMEGSPPAYSPRTRINNSHVYVQI